LFVIGGNYARKNPFFENCVRIKNNSINTGAFLDVLQGDDSIKDNTVVGVVSDIFDNDAELKEKMHAVTVAKAFSQLKEKVSEYYDESN
jgi:CRISPR-associated protein Cst2